MFEISMLGTFEAKLDGQPIQGLQERRANRLLALLTLERNRQVQRQWIEIVLDTSYDGLRKAESILRACLGDEKIRIKVEKNSLFMDVRDIWVDAFAFEDLIALGDMESLGRAIRLYRGGLLKDWDGGWLLEKREELQESYLEALQTVTRTAIQEREYDKAATYLRRFVHVYPNMDSAWAHLIEVYRHAGNVCLAEEAYEMYLARLENIRREEGRVIHPSQRVVEALKSPCPNADPSAASPRPNTGSLSAPIHFEPAGGAVPLNSPYYIVRRSDEMASSALQPQTSYILIKGARQIGKTSLLARLLQQGREGQARVLRTDWQNIPQTDMLSAETFLLNVAGTIADQLKLDMSPIDCFDRDRPATRNFERFLLRQVFPAVDGWLIWGIDEADRLFECPFKDDIFGMLRSWHNERSLDPGCEWERLTVVLSYATEAHLIQNLNQSPFNIGFSVELTDFTLDQVEKLNRRYGAPLHDKHELSQLYSLVGGHPFLVRRTLQEMALRQWDIAEVETQAQLDRGFFRDHLERMRLALLRDAELIEAMRAWQRHETNPSPEHFARLCAAGVVVGSSPSEMRMRCRLYEQFLRRAFS